MKNSFNTHFLIFLLFSLLLCCSSSNDVLHNSCEEASRNDPNFSYEFCISCLEKNPKSRNASLEALVVISIGLNIAKATEISSYISQLLKEKKFDKPIKIRLQDCFGFYSNANSSLQDALAAFGKKDYFTANIKVSAAMDAPGDCEDEFKEKRGLVSPLTKEDNIFFQMTAIPLAFINMCHS